MVSSVAAQERAGKDLQIMGSGALIQCLLPRGLIDEYLLMIHPLVLGSERRLFADGTPPGTSGSSTRRSQPLVS
jgi:dihydrofolate reductase